MSSLFTNETMENDMTDRFLCILYYQDRNNREVLEGGMDPTEIWETMHYKAFQGAIISQIIDKLVYNNAQKGYITVNQSTGRITLTEAGRVYGSQRCPGIAGVT